MPKLEINPKIIPQGNDKIYCQEDYADELYKIYLKNSSNMPLSGKDIQSNQLMNITGVGTITDEEIYFEVNNMINIPIELNKEKKFFELYNADKSKFKKWLKTTEGKSKFLKENHLIYIEKPSPEIKASLLKGYQFKLKEELFKQIKKQTVAYSVKIIERNRGGFITDIHGLRGFLPGGLAAANKISNFDEYVDKEINVMVEDYIPEIDTFIFSHKKYIKNMLPVFAKELDLSKEHIGIITGSIKFGIFLEFNEIFTGLLHVSKMKPEIREKFEKNELKSGEEFKCWIKDIDDKYKLILSNYEPGSGEDELKEGEEYEGRITAIKKFGIFIKLKTGEVGLVHTSLINDITQFSQGEKIKVRLKEINDDEKYNFEIS